MRDREYDNLSDDVVQFDPPLANGASILYAGNNSDPDATDADPNWIIKKFVYTDGAITKIIKKKGAWSDRVALFS